MEITGKPQYMIIMKNILVIVLLLFSVTFLFLVLKGETTLTEEQSLDILVSQISKDKLYDKWTTLSCLYFVTEKKDKDYFDFAVYEKHDDKCHGDRNTSSIADRFRINRVTREIQWYNPVQNKFLPYMAIYKARMQNIL